MYLEILPLNDDVKSMYENHSTFHEGDAGLDLFCPEDIVVKAGETVIIDLKIQCQAFIKDIYKFLDNCSCKYYSSYYLYPRSSISKTPLRMANSVGIIDAGYRGNIMMPVDNIKNEDYTIKKGDRLCQICSPSLTPIKFNLTTELTTTSRGTDGIGSTGTGTTEVI